MKNRYLDDRTEADIDHKIAKILRDLGNPAPPLRLELVRELLDLDLRYYSSSDPGVLQETVHRLRVAGKQVIKRPGLLLDVVRRLDLKALFVPDTKRILLDADLATPKQRWGEAHEIGHSVIEWHSAMMHGDQERTLGLSCQEQIEGEANYAAGRLLFLRDEFTRRVKDTACVDFDFVKKIKKEFGNTMASTVWRIAETLEAPAFTLVSQHPNEPLDKTKPAVRYFVRSRMFEKQFASICEAGLFEIICGFCFGKRGPIGNDVVVLKDANGDAHEFHVQTFWNGYEALTLGTYVRKRSVVIGVGQLQNAAYE